MRSAIAAFLMLLLGSTEDSAAQLRTTTDAPSTATVASLGSQISDLQAAMPSRCASAPVADTLNGTLQSGTKCYTSYNDTRPTLVQAANVSTLADGTWTVSWGKSFSGATPYITAQAINPSDSQPYICNVASSTTTTASGRCWKTQTNTLPGVALSLLGLLLNPTASTGIIQVRVAGRDTTQ